MTAARAVDDVLAALADPVRRRAVELLRERPHRAGELAERLGLAAPAMSRHLKLLKDSGLASESHPEIDARVRVYTLNAARLADLRDWLAEAEAGWTTQLSAFGRHMRAKSAGAAKTPASRRRP